MKLLRDQRWWTAADAAELDCLVGEFVRVAFLHRDRCPECKPGRPWCAVLTDAFEAVVEFRDRRRVLSEAQWLRARQELSLFAGRLRVA